MRLKDLPTLSPPPSLSLSLSLSCVRQTRPTPDSTDPLVKFYSSLHEQSKGGSAMAAKWLMQHGMLPLAEATKLANSIAMAKKRSAVKVEGTRAKGTAKAKASAPKRRKKGDVAFDDGGL